MHLSLIDNFNLNILILAFWMKNKNSSSSFNLIFCKLLGKCSVHDNCIDHLNFQKSKIENKYFIEYIADFIWPINLRFKTELYFQISQWRWQLYCGQSLKVKSLSHFIGGVWRFLIWMMFKWNKLNIFQYGLDSNYKN